MKNFIGCGGLSSLHLYILYSILFKGLRHLTINFNFFNYDSVLNKHILIKSLYKYISFIVFGKFFLNCTKKSTNNNKRPKKRKNKIIYYIEPEISNNSLIYLIIISIIYVFFLELVEISYSMGFHDFDLWIFNLVFILLFTSRILPTKIYNHQKISLLFVIFTNFVLIILKGFYAKNNAYKLTEKIFKNKLFSIVIFLLYIINSYLISFSRVLGKVLMDIKYVSPYSIIIMVGIFGLIFTSILIIISSLNKCKEPKIIDAICKVKASENEELAYFDSISIYFKNLRNNTKFLIEILIITPLYFFFHFMEFNYEILLIYYLNPIYILISDSLYYGGKSLYSFIIKSANEKDNEEDNIHLTYDLIGNLSACFAYLIYVEIIELKFCGLNKNIRKNIRERGDSEIYRLRNEEDNDEEEEDDENDG